MTLSSPAESARRPARARCRAAGGCRRACRRCARAPARDSRRSRRRACAPPTGARSVIAAELGEARGAARRAVARPQLLARRRAHDAGRDEEDAAAGGDEGRARKAAPCDGSGREVGEQEGPRRGAVAAPQLFAVGRIAGEEVDELAGGGDLPRDRTRRSPGRCRPPGAAFPRRAVRGPQLEAGEAVVGGEEEEVARGGQLARRCCSPAAAAGDGCRRPGARRRAPAAAREAAAGRRTRRRARQAARDIDRRLLRSLQPLAVIALQTNPAPPLSHAHARPQGGVSR